MPIYRCNICNMESKQKSHHKKHKKTQKHADKCAIFKLELEKLSKEELNDKYNETDIINILRKEMNHKLKPVSPKNNIIQPEEGASKEPSLTKKRKTNKLIYEKSKESITETEEEENFKAVFLNFFGKMHNLLRGASVTGINALNDILYVLLYCYVAQNISEEGRFDIANITKPCYKTLRKIKDYIKYFDITYLLEHTSELRLKGRNSIWKIGHILSKHPITKSLIKDEDFINCSDTNTLYKLIENCQKFTKENNVFEKMDLIGIAYEYMTTKHAGNGGQSKEMGQYFTERPLMSVCFTLIDQIDIEELGINNESTIGDEFCATLGFPLMAKKYLSDTFNINIQDKNIYGVEYSERLARFAYMNALFSMTNTKHITRGDSFITNIKPHIDLSIHNVPFGKSMTPKNIEKKYNSFLQENPGKGYPTFEKLVPYHSKKIDAILASQIVLYKTKKMGLMIIKDGEETSGKSNAKYRKWFSENCIIKKIMKIPSGAFSCTGTKTVCIYFIKKEGQMTENIQFLQLSDDGNQITEICNVTMDDMKHNHYSWEPNSYIIDEEMEKMMSKSKCEWNKLSDICNFTNGYSFKSIHYKNKGIPIISIKHIPFDKSNSFNYYSKNEHLNKYEIHKNDILIALTGATIGKIGIYNLDCTGYLNQRVAKITSKNDKLYIEKFIYYVLNTEKTMKIIKNKSSGSAQENISTKKLGEIIVVPIVPFEKQQEMVQIFDDLSEQKNILINRKSGIDRQMEYYLKCKIQKYVNLTECEWANLGDVSTILTTTKHYTKIGKKHGKYRFYNSSQKDRLFVDFAEVTDESIIIGNGGELCVHYNNNGFTASKHVSVIQMSNSCITKFVYYYLLKNISLLKKQSTGAGIQWLNKTKMKNIKIPLPSIEKQTEIVQYLDKLEIEKNNIDIKINDINELSANILEQSYM